MTVPNPAGSTGAATPTDAGQSPDTSSAEGWQSTRAQTHLARDENDYLSPDTDDTDDIGRLVAENQRELFVSCDAGPAMQQQFEHLWPRFIAIHDVATHASRKLLAGIAAASKSAVQKLVIRRQGYGTTLATLEFVELPTRTGRKLRVYSTEADADTTSRHALARALLAYSTLGVILVGEAPGHTLTGVFKPLHEDMIHGPWPNRNILLLPLSTANALVAQGMELGRGTGVNVRTTPQVTRPADAWNFINSTWGKLNDESQPEPPAPEAAAPPPRFIAPRREATPPPNAYDRNSGATNIFGTRQPVETGARPTGPLPMRPMPSVPSAASPDESPRDPLTRYAKQLSELTGMVSVCIFEVASGRALVHAGASPGPNELALHGSDLMAAMLNASRTLGLGHALPDAAITLGSHHLVLRAVPKHPGLAVHTVLDKTHANLTLARLQIMRMDAVFDEPASH